VGKSLLRFHRKSVMFAPKCKKRSFGPDQTPTELSTILSGQVFDFGHVLSLVSVNAYLIHALTFKIVSKWKTLNNLFKGLWLGRTNNEGVASVEVAFR
jgi:hypothetical protein